MKILKISFLVIIIIIISLVIFGFLFLKLHPTFGGKPTGKSQVKITNSTNWNGNKFVNLVPTSISTRNENSDNYGQILREYIFQSKNKNPNDKLPSSRLDKNNFQNGDMAWFGHSTVLFKTDDVVILADPVFHNASPIPGTVRPFEVEYKNTINDLPEHIDFIIISHDHYDHLDYQAIEKLDKKTDKFLVGLGVKAHLLRWGVQPEKIVEFDWYEQIQFGNVSFVFTPTRHFSGRGLTDRYKTLWGSWVVLGSDLKLFFSGDSGYFDEFKTIGNKYGPFDIAFIEDGAYNADWSEIHMLPEQLVQASIDLKAQYMAPIHWAKFDLSRHTWKEPIERILVESDIKHINLATPVIGETFNLNTIPTLKWWEGVE